METYIHKVKYYECDRMGVTHHSNYVRFMEEARVDFLDRIGCPFEKIEAEGMVSPVVSIECNYRKTTTFQDEIEIVVFISELSALKMKIGYKMSVGGSLVCTGESTHCFLKDGRPVNIPEHFPLFSELVGRKSSDI